MNEVLRSDGLSSATASDRCASPSIALHRHSHPARPVAGRRSFGTALGIAFAQRFQRHSWHDAVGGALGIGVAAWTRHLSKMAVVLTGAPAFDPSIAQCRLHETSSSPRARTLLCPSSHRGNRALSHVRLIMGRPHASFFSQAIISSGNGDCDARTSPEMRNSSRGSPTSWNSKRRGFQDVLKPEHGSDNLPEIRD